MAGLQWFELDVGFHRDPKVKALNARIREPLADAYVCRLYAYCYEHLQERFDPEVAVQIIEDAAGWRGRRGTLFDALMAVEVLEREAGKVVVHGVKARLGPHIAHRVAAAERQKRRRERFKVIQPVTENVTRDVERDSRGTSRGTSRPAMYMSGISRSNGTSSNDETTSTVPSQDAFAADLEREASSPLRPVAASSRVLAVSSREPGED